MEQGNRVALTKEQLFFYIKGDEGKVAFIDDKTKKVAVRFDKNLDGHTCNGHCDDGHGWFVDPSDLKVISTEEFNVK